MRTSDIWQAKQNPSYVKTEKLYVDTDTPVEKMSLEEAKRGMCAAAGNDVLKCEACSAKCKFGRRIVDLLKPVEMEMPKQAAARKHNTKNAHAVRSEKSENAYLMAIASGNPLQWLIDHGRDPNNGMQRLKQRFGDMTAEEAQARLDAKGTNLPVLEHTVAAKPVEQVAEPKAQPAPKPVHKAKLKVSAVDGEYFCYSLCSGQLKLTSGQGTLLVDVKNIPAMCAEIVQAAEMMGGSDQCTL